MSRLLDHFLSKVFLQTLLYIHFRTKVVTVYLRKDHPNLYFASDWLYHIKGLITIRVKCYVRPWNTEMSVSLFLPAPANIGPTVDWTWSSDV